ncbi:hypothetical protein N7494_012277 [Penicillium frequentans]|uniref:Uncharacterized protein n=1 Tax=Penicillium frequentans TaxID=3151616 RepID=A0AAD6CL96_9EURO|nr:hypothetical protein N7494_012277 [Penicillium glabrum]
MFFIAYVLLQFDVGSTVSHTKNCIEILRALEVWEVSKGHLTRRYKSFGANLMNSQCYRRHQAYDGFDITPGITMLDSLALLSLAWKRRWPTLRWRALKSLRTLPKRGWLLSTNLYHKDFERIPKLE